VKLRLPLIFTPSNRSKCSELISARSNGSRRRLDHVLQLYLMQAVVPGEIENFVKFPPRQKPASFNLDAVLAQVSNHGGHA
jgi:hypothetical protein